MKQEKIHVLHIIGKRPIGGIGNVLLNYQTYLDCKEIQMDYLIFSDNPDGVFDTKVKVLGSQIYVLPELKEIRVFYIWHKLNIFFQKNRFDIVHIHSPNIAAICFYLAKKYGIKNRILHSHSTVYAAKKWNCFRNRVLCFPLRWLATDLIACSREIGKLVKDKNQIFLIHIVAEILKKKPDIRLLLIGSGELEETLKREANQLGVQNNIIFYGYTQNVEKLLQVMDIFVMTSLNEGLPLVALEAQAAGLPCLLSSNITKEVSLRNCFYLSLDCGYIQWANKIMTILENWNGERKIEDKLFIDKGFAIEQEAEKLGRYYKNLQ